MTDVVKHAFVSSRLDGTDVTQIQPSHWNAGHKFSGGAAGDILTRDPNDPTFGARWTPSATAGVDATVGTVNDWNPGGGSLAAAPHTFVQWVGASGLHVTGILAAPFHYVTIQNSVAAVITFFNASTGSGASNRLNNPAASGGTPIGFGGWITYYHNGGVWLMVGHEPGAWITPAFAAVDYTAQPPMIWTVTAGQVNSCKYRLAGRTLHWTLDVAGTTVGGTPASHLYRAIPGGFRASAPCYGWVQAYGATAIPAMHFHTGTQIDFLRDATGLAWPAGTLFLSASGTVEVD
jgi:hypothetical protein